ncbi:hypothetical protein FJZ31_09495 [Candidatus Poribacteria bacterium]|nr:hypothetical protein [Candidatus Poribacteria bacterium]
MKRIFVDSWGWCAMVNRREEYHELVQDLIAELVAESAKLYTTNFIIDETYTLIRTRVHHRAAVEFHRKLQIMINGKLLEVIYLTPEVEQDAWTIFERYDDKDFSFTLFLLFLLIKLFFLKEKFGYRLYFLCGNEATTHCIGNHR